MNSPIEPVAPPGSKVKPMNSMLSKSEHHTLEIGTLRTIEAKAKEESPALIVFEGLLQDVSSSKDSWEQ